jgi:SprT-like family
MTTDSESRCSSLGSHIGTFHCRYIARVELSVKVVDRLERLEATLAHELCHAACWVLNHTAKPPHGQVLHACAVCLLPVEMCQCSVCR